MADKQLSIKINATDSASPVFAKLGKSASDAGKDISTSAQTASTSMTALGDSAKKAESNLKDFSDAGTQFGTGLAALGGAFAIYSQSVVDNERNVANLSRTYGDASSAFQDLADQLQDTTIFSNDDVIAAANSFGTLARNYGLTTDQIQELIRVSADLAATSGLSLVDAATRVQAAIRGEGEAAEALGLTMNQASIDTGNLTLTMSNAEAGQFRYTALLKQAAFAQGAAAEQAQTTAGRVQHLANQVQDAAQAFVDFTGPVGPAVAGMSSFGLEAGLALTGIIQLGRGINTTASAIGGFGTLLGPAGFALALAGAFYGAKKLGEALQTDFEAGLAHAIASTDDLNTAISSLSMSMADAQQALAFTNIGSGLDQTIKDLERIDFLNKQVNTIPVGGRAAQDTIAAYQAELDALTAKYGDLDSAATEAAAAQDDLTAILTHSSAGAKDAQARALELSQEYANGTITLEEYAWQLNWITENFANYDEAALSAAASTQQLAESAKSFQQISKDAFDAAQAVGVLDSTLEQLQAAGLNTPAFNISANIDGSALANTFDMLVKGSQKLADTAGDIAKWSRELTTAEEGVSTLKSLLDSSAISVDTYNAALAANTRIQSANAQIQQDIAAIQANQLPLMAQLTEQQAAYISSLADLPAQQQMVALGYLDAAESARALELAQLAASAAAGELGDTGTATASKIIAAAAEADPVLKAMLTDMGLISEGAEGEVVVNFPNATDLNTAVTNLTASIDALTAAISNLVPIDVSAPNADNTTSAINEVTAAANGVPSNVNVNIGAVDGATGTISAVRSQLDALNGTSATVYISPVVTGSVPSSGSQLIGGMTGLTISAMATGGTLGADIPRYAIGGTHGGSYAIVGDGGGPEMVWLPTGAQVTNAVATRSKRQSIEARRGGDINIYGPMTLNPAGSDAYAAIQQEMMGGARR